MKNMILLLETLVLCRGKKGFAVNLIWFVAITVIALLFAYIGLLLIGKFSSSGAGILEAYE